MLFSTFWKGRLAAQEVEPLIPGVLQGIHVPWQQYQATCSAPPPCKCSGIQVCILAYGQTGAGKTCHRV